MNRDTKVTLLVLLLMASVPAIVFGQSFQAAISGIVADPTGAVAPNVKVTVTDSERGVSFSTITNQDGVYVINNLIPSTYRVTAEAPGFETHQLNSFPLTAKQEAVLNITMRLGATNQTVEVQAEAQMVDPSNATLGGVVNNKAIIDLPLVNRNVLTLMAIEPGVRPPPLTITRATSSRARSATRSTGVWNRLRISNSTAFPS